ncbi:Txe/YoeB family addiction module toxin [Bacteroidia bacterium]|nr:Txe/YoeB family addiction module toxin [Bacteroidia bacterium]
MEVIYSEQAQKDIEYWKKSGNKAIMKRISTLIENIQKHPFTGIDKPEPLKYDLSGSWSRRINSEHRIIYAVHEGMIEIYVLSMRYHYPK